jgi:calcineurin-like phosphoesterase family protein
MSAPSIRWFHFSDFHTGKDDYGQRRLFEQLLDYVAQRLAQGFVPDLIFLTGDIANKGQRAEYELFTDNFYLPLLELLGGGWQGRIYAIPGNHDVNRNEARAVRRYDVLADVPYFLDPSDAGLIERSPLLTRFAEYIGAGFGLADPHWLVSPRGFASDIIRTESANVGVLSLNTAWLSGSDDDRHHMTPGKSIVDEGLKSIAPSDVKIVLGHHPIDWFSDSEIEPITALFAKNEVLYLHGHLHRGKMRQISGAGFQFHSLQTGAAFQARESDKWVNGFLECELDTDSRRLQSQALQWSRDDQEWKVDMSAFPNQFRESDKFVFQLGAIKSHSEADNGQKERELKAHTPVQSPHGWDWIDASFIALAAASANDASMSQFFDGGQPGWGEVGSKRVKARQVVSSISGSLLEPVSSERPRVALIIGAAGEGKTTALMQVVDCIANSDSPPAILWHTNTESPLQRAQLLELAANGQRILIASDDAEVIASEVFEASKLLHLQKDSNVSFVLACRDTDWINDRCHMLPWRQQTEFVVSEVKGVSIADAAAIIDSWAGLGPTAMGKLQGLDNETAVKRLVAEAETSKENSGKSLLGALLRVKYGSDLKEHIWNLLLRLNERKLSGFTLLDAFLYIAVMDSMNLTFLSKSVLAETLGITRSELARQVLGPLGREAAASASGIHVFTRHQAIAESAVQLATDRLYEDVDEHLISLAEAALRRAKSEYVPELREWRFLSTTIFDHGKHELGIRLGEAVLRADPTNSFLVVNLSRMYRDVGRADLSRLLFHQLSRPERGLSRTLFSEWSVVEGAVGNDAMNAYLAGIALSDQVKSGNMSRERHDFVYGIAALLWAVKFMIENHGYSEASEAHIALAVMLNRIKPPEMKLIDSVAQIVEEILSGCNLTLSPDEATGFLKKVVDLGWTRREDDFALWIPNVDELTFTRFQRAYAQSLT